MTAGANSVSDVWFYFSVTGSTNSLGLAVGGSGSSIFERACTTAIDRNSANNCTGGIANQLVSLTNTSGQSAVAGSFGPVVSLSIFKDINVRGGSGPAELTTFSQSFGSPVPEPATFGVVGMALLGLGYARRRKAKS
jgi:hypothetical protein